MSSREDWPAEHADLTGVEDEVEEAEAEAAEAYDEAAADEPDAADTGDQPELAVAARSDGLAIPHDVSTLEGEPRSTSRGVGIVISREPAEAGNELLEAALAELERAGVEREQVLVMAVPGPFELPLGAMALAKTRRYACIVALGSATESELVAGETASGLQLAGLETGIPVSFGVLTDAGQTAGERGAAAVRRALEMADLFHRLRASAKAG